MKRIYLVLALLLALMCPAFASAAEVSGDKMILDWTTSKVWVSGGDLCVTGSFVNKRSDLTITKLNDFVMRITFTDKDGQQRQFTGSPVKLPLCKIAAGGSRKMNFNFGKFEHDINNWVTAQTYTFTYINGARF